MLARTVELQERVATDRSGIRAIHLLRKLDPAAWGGTETALQRLFKGLRQHNVQSVVYCPRLTEPNGHIDPVAADGHQVNRFKAFVPVLGMPEVRRRQLVSVGGNLMSFDLIPSLWREPNVSLVHAHTLGRIGAIARTLAKQRGVPFVVTIHGGVLDLPEKVKQAFNEPIRDGVEWGKMFSLLFRSNRLFQDADAILTCNPREAALWRDKLPDKRVIVQPHGVETGLYEIPQCEAAYKAFPQLLGKRILLMLGRVDPIKNQGWVLQQAPAIFQRYPDATIVCVGACTDEPYGQQIDAQLRELGLADRVLLTGGMRSDDPRLIGLLQASEVLLLPSLSETFGLVILEAWSAGTPVLCSATSGARALVRDRENGCLFSLEEPEAFHRW